MVIKEKWKELIKRSAASNMSGMSGKCDGLPTGIQNITDRIFRISPNEHSFGLFQISYNCFIVGTLIYQFICPHTIRVKL